MVVTALYGSSMSGSSFDYVSYIYLLAPVSLAIINPIGFCLMEYNKQATKRKLHMKQVSIIGNSHSHQSHHLLRLRFSGTCSHVQWRGPINTYYEIFITVLILISKACTAYRFYTSHI